jgi:DNA (cytosine-5)-methyltransferase 1
MALRKRAEVQTWPTPTTQRQVELATGAPGDGFQDMLRLAKRATPNTMLGEAWPTPTTTDAKSSARHGYMITGQQGTTLLDAVRLWPREFRWPTPRARDGAGWDTKPRKGGTGVDLEYVARLWPTHTGDQLPEQVLKMAPPSPPDPTTPTDGEPTSSDTRVLNPRFVEALMGFPLGWTDCALSETPSSRSRRQQLSEFLLSATASMPSPSTRGRRDL